MKRGLLLFTVLLLCGLAACACADISADTDVLTRFYYSCGGSFLRQSWEIIYREDGCTLRENEGEARDIAPEFAAELEEAVREYNLKSWDGFHESDSYVLDGENFCLELEFADGTSVYATGDNAFPDSYNDATACIYSILEREKMSRLAGTYRYEGGGFGGDFTVTLNADGTYTFCEGPLSSYLGAGTWNTWYDAVYMEEDEEAGYELHFTFGVEDGALIYLAMGSDGFTCVQVSDGERFMRQDMSSETNE